jgi:hypothetical protein
MSTSGKGFSCQVAQRAMRGEAMPVSGATKTAAILIGVEALGVAGVAATQVLSLAAAASVPNAVALLLLTLVAAAALAAFSFAVMTGRSWGRSGAIVAQALIFAIAVGSVTGTYPHWGIGLSLGIPALVVFAVLLLAVRDAGSASRAAGPGSED